MKVNCLQAMSDEKQLHLSVKEEEECAAAVKPMQPLLRGYKSNIGRPTQNHHPGIICSIF